MSLGSAGEGDGGFGNASFPPTEAVGQTERAFSLTGSESHSSVLALGGCDPHECHLSEVPGFCAGAQKILGRSRHVWGEHHPAHLTSRFGVGQRASTPSRQLLTCRNTAQQLEEAFPLFTATSWDPRSELKVVAF